DCRTCGFPSITARPSTLRAAESPTAHRCVTPLNGRRRTPGASCDEPLGRANSGTVDPARFHPADAESGESAREDPETSRRHVDIGRAVKKHWLAVVVLFLVAGAWGASFTIVKSVLTRIPPEPFIVLRFTIAGVVLLAIALSSRQLPRSALRPGVILGALVF